MFTSNTSDMACNYIQEKPKHRMTKTRSHTFHLESFQDVIHTLLIALKLKRNERFLIDIYLNIILLLKTKLKKPINSVKNVLIFNLLLNDFAKRACYKPIYKEFLLKPILIWCRQIQKSTKEEMLKSSNC